MADFPDIQLGPDLAGTPKVGANQVKYNRVTTGVKYDQGRYRVWIKYSHTDHPETKQEMSRKTFATAHHAERVAEFLGRDLRRRLG